VRRQHKGEKRSSYHSILGFEKRKIGNASCIQGSEDAKDNFSYRDNFTQTFAGSEKRQNKGGMSIEQYFLTQGKETRTTTSASSSTICKERGKRERETTTYY